MTVFRQASKYDGFKEIIASATRYFDLFCPVVQTPVYLTVHNQMCVCVRLLKFKRLQFYHAHIEKYDYG